MTWVLIMVIQIFVNLNQELLITLTCSKGRVQLWIDGNLVIDLDGLCLRETEAGKVKGMHFQTFFGGTLPILYGVSSPI